MYRRLAGSEGSVLGYRVEGTITDAEVKEMHQDLLAAIERHDRASLLVEIGPLGLPEPAAMLRELRLTPEYLRDVERFAIVGHGRWQEWATRLTDLVAQGEARHFEPAELDRAWEWVRHGPPKL